MEELKTCTKCGITKPVSEFSPASYVRKDGTRLPRSNCKRCNNPPPKGRKRKPDHKVCTQCGIDKPLSEFFPIHYYTKKYGRVETTSSSCRACKIAEYSPGGKFNESKKASRKRRYREDPRISLLHAAKSRAKRKGLEFDIELSDIEIPKTCPVLDIPIVVNDGVKKGNSISLDRIDPRKGYVKGNVCVISYQANTIKNDATVEELESVIQYIDNYYGNSLRSDTPIGFFKGHVRNDDRWKLLMSARFRARRRGIPCSISVEDIVIPEFCPVFNVPLKGVGGKRARNSPSLDRISPKEGYVPGNVAVISDRANRIKNDATVAEIRAVISYMQRF